MPYSGVLNDYLVDFKGVIPESVLYRFRSMDYSVSHADNLYMQVLKDFPLSNKEKAYLVYLLLSLYFYHPYTYGHSFRVSYLAKVMYTVGNKIVDEEDIKILGLAGLLHDVGKLLVSDDILNKPSKLDYDEYNEAKCHVDYGLQILKVFGDSNFFSSVANLIYMHHERQDGSGYPRGLKGDELPFLVQIIALSDTVDSITSNRPYLMDKDLRYVKDIINEDLMLKRFYFSEKVLELFLNLPVEFIQKFLVNSVDTGGNLLLKVKAL